MGGGPDPLFPLRRPGSTPLQGQGERQGQSEQEQHGCERYGLIDFSPTALILCLLYFSVNAYVTSPHARN
jgi:hypothetical protein